MSEQPYLLSGGVAAEQSAKDFNDGLDAALTVIADRRRAYKQSRERSGNPVGVIETELLRVERSIFARRRG